MGVDIIEQNIHDIDAQLLNTLLQDKTTGQRIRWATDDYEKYGDGYYAEREIDVALITGQHTFVIQPRVSKSLVEQNQRTKDKAEVFTPSWLCNVQNNLIDTAWFGRESVFNRETNHAWEVNEEKIEFPQGKTWKAYVDARRMEICCGEAPYLASRYDTTTGDSIPVVRRIGLLDRKLRVVSENAVSEDEWYYWAIRAFQSVYAYEYQGDNLLLARENLLYTFLEHHFDHFHSKADLSITKKIANIITWNIWQMDATTMTPPRTSRNSRDELIGQCSFFPEEDDTHGIPCRIYDWRANKSLSYTSLVNGGESDGC